MISCNFTFQISKQINASDLYQKYGAPHLTQICFYTYMCLYIFVYVHRNSIDSFEYFRITQLFILNVVSYVHVKVGNKMRPLKIFE